MSVHRHRLAADGGFTLIEVMVAMVILVVGLLSVAGLLAKASPTTALTGARAGGLPAARARGGRPRVLYADSCPRRSSAACRRTRASPTAARRRLERQARRGGVHALRRCVLGRRRQGQPGPQTPARSPPTGRATTAQTCRNLLGSGGEISGAPGAGGAGAAAGTAASTRTSIARRTTSSTPRLRPAGVAAAIPRTPIPTTSSGSSRSRAGRLARGCATSCSRRRSLPGPLGRAQPRCCRVSRRRSRTRRWRASASPPRPTARRRRWAGPSTGRRWGTRPACAPPASRSRGR